MKRSLPGAASGKVTVEIASLMRDDGLECKDLMKNL